MSSLPSGKGYRKCLVAELFLDELSCEALTSVLCSNLMDCRKQVWNRALEGILQLNMERERVRSCSGERGEATMEN